MKQKYVKPVVILERFSLTECIASGCANLSSSTLGSPNNSSKEYCEWVTGSDGVELFLSAGTVCDNVKDLITIGFITGPVDEYTPVYGVCYNNPEGATVFGSV